MMACFKPALLVLPAVLVAFGLAAAGRGLSQADSRVAQPLPRASVAVGHRVVLPPLKDFAGAAHELADLLGEKATVIAMVDRTCPIALKYRPALARLEDDYREQGVRFIFLNASGTDMAEDV